MGLAEGDPVLRQYLIQKLLRLAEDLGGASQPLEDSDARAFFDHNRETWVTPAHVRFLHQPVACEGDEPRRTKAGPFAPEMNADVRQLEAAFGAEFTAALVSAPISTWTAPLRSSRGCLRVRVIAHEPERPATFDEVRPRVKMALLLLRKS